MPRTIVHPGEILLEDFLKPHGLTPSAFAERIGLPPNRITSIVNGRRSITPETAILLAEAFGTSVELWLNLQSHHDLLVARDKVGPNDARRAKARALHRELEVA